MTALSDSRPPLERRGLDEAPRVEQASTQAVLCGYAIKFDQLSEPLGTPPFRELVRPSALAHLAERRDVKCLIGHDPTRVVGSTKSGTLQLKADHIGLRFRLVPPDSPTGLDLVESVKRGDLDGVSIGFRVMPDGESWRTSRPPVRELRDIDIHELSLVCWPAYAGAGVQIEQRALQHAAEPVARESSHERARELEALTARVNALR